MSATLDNRAVRPELVARKLECVRNFEHMEVLEEINAEPRLVELLWFLQWVSNGENYVGGLQKFTRDLIAKYEDLIGTATMADGSEAWDPDTRRGVLCELPAPALRDLALKAPVRGVGYWLGGDDGRDAENELREQERVRASRLEKLTRVEVLSVCVGAAREELTGYLQRLCEGTGVRFRRKKGERHHHRDDLAAPWYFAGVAGAILRFMDWHKDDIAGEIAETAVSREMFFWLDLSARARDSIIIEGNSRYGKTEAVRAWCRMNPGRARLVETPSSNSEGDLLKAIATSLGIESALTQSGAYLRPQIEYVLRQSRVLLVFDEAHFLWPSKLSKTAVPARLNWIRRSVMDAGLPVAFICTPQSYAAAQERFVKATRYPIEQLEGRFLPTVRLPETVPADDLLAIARKHLPGVGDACLLPVATMLDALGRTYCSDVSRIARLAQINAEDAGRRIPSVADIKAAMLKALPQAAAALRPVLGAEAVPTDFRPPAKRVSRPCTAPSETAPRRQIAQAPSIDDRETFEAPRRDDSPVIPAS